MVYEDIYNQPFTYHEPPKISPAVVRMQMRMREAIEESAWEEVWDIEDSLGRHGFFHT